MVALLVGFILLSFGCGGKNQETPGGDPLVVTSIVPQAYFVTRLVGDDVRVSVMIPPGASPSTFEPTMAQMTAMSEAALYIKVGHENFPFEKVWLEKLLENASGVEVVDCSDGIPSIDGDPHIWTSFVHAEKMADTIAAGLRKVYPEKSDRIDTNLASLKKEIEAAHGSAKKAFAGHEGSKFFVFHAAWTYLAADYGLKQVVLEHGHKEPCSHHVQSVIEDASASGAKVIFTQPQMSRSSAELVAKEIGGEVWVIDPLAEDWLGGMKDAMHKIAKAIEK